MMDERIEAHRVASRLWVGSYPTQQSVCRYFDTVVLCAYEHQTVPFTGCHIVKAPLDDAVPTQSEVHTAISAARTVHAMRQREKRVLVTCAQGVNRSALVAAMALMLDGWPAPLAVHQIREYRKPPIGMKPLSNQHFTKLLERLDRRRPNAPHTPISAF
jgi:protein-tyrosine phosphatase